MYRPSMYSKHDETMNNFAVLFNSLSIHKNIEMRPNPVETFDNDGIFIDIITNRSIGYDWEYRDRYFSYCKLAFESLGQYERKLKKTSIQLSLQCDSTETGLAVGWHEDWLVEERERRALRTDYYQKENGAIRYTENFRIYSFEEVDRFKNMVASAMRLQLYSSKIFALMEGVKNRSTDKSIEIKRPIDPQNNNSSSNTPTTLVSFFKSKGLNVVDKRPKGGCLWVIGSEAEIGAIIQEACKRYHIGGHYGSGRAIGYKNGWFTKASK